MVHLYYFCSEVISNDDENSDDININVNSWFSLLAEFKY